MVPPERSMTLVEQCQNARVEQHEGGEWSSLLGTHMMNRTDEHRSLYTIKSILAAFFQVSPGVPQP